MLAIGKVTVRKAEWRDVAMAHRNIWTASYTVGYSGNYEPAVRFFSSWAEAYNWAFRWQLDAISSHLDRVRMTYCDCAACLRYGPRARRVNG